MKLVIFKPSIILGDSTTYMVTSPQTIYGVALAVAKLHKGAENLRRKIERALRLPVLESVFRIKGNEDTILDIVPVNWVAEMIAIVNEPGTYYLTNASSPTAGEICVWMSPIMNVNLRVERDFNATAIEAAFEHTASPVLDYIRNPAPKFNPSFNNCPELGKEFIQKTVEYVLNG